MKNFILGAILAPLLLANGYGNPLTLTKNGAPASTIVINAQAEEAEEQAAHILQEYLKNISGATLPIETDDKEVSGTIISVGKTKLLPADIKKKVNLDESRSFIDPANDAIAISVRENNIFLVGHQGKATVFSVYDFLESLGCRWFFACKAGEVIPNIPTIQLEKQEVVKTPTFGYRNDYSWDFPGRQEETAAWQIANKMDPKNWYGGHNFSTIWPTSLFEEHPEYFPLVDGKRTSKGQRCLSNPDVIKIGIEWADKTLMANPNLNVVPLICNDGETGFCQCDNCKAIGNFGDQTMYMANEVGKELFKKHPDKMISVICYFEAARSIHTKADGYDENKDRIVVTIYSNFAKEPFHDVIKSWGKASHHLNICKAWQWLYYSNGHRQGNPVSYTESYLKDYPFYKKSNAFGISTEGCFDWARNGFSRYCSTKFKWDVNADLEELRLDFCEKMFPNASEAFYNFINLYDEFHEKKIDLKGFLRKGFFFMDEIRLSIKTGEELERWEFFALYLHERTLAIEFDAIDNENKKAQIRHLWQTISFLKGIEDRGVLDSQNWIATFYVPLLKESYGERPTSASCPEMPAMKVDSTKIETWYDQDRQLFKTSVPVMHKKLLVN